MGGVASGGFSFLYLGLLKVVLLLILGERSAFCRRRDDRLPFVGPVPGSSEEFPVRFDLKSARPPI